ncbi:TPA: hypothetical protein R1765_001949 [Campylobacter coli]|nr:hypothetical protein [Campylobacter coli]
MGIIIPKYTFLQLYYMTKRILEEHEGRQSKEQWLLKASKSKGIIKLMYRIAADLTCSEALCKAYYHKTDKELDDLVNSYKSSVHFLNDWARYLDKLKEKINLKRKAIYEND